MKYIVVIDYREGCSSILGRQLFDTFKQATDALAARLHADFGEDYSKPEREFGWDIVNGNASTENECYEVVELKDYNEMVIGNKYG